MMTMRDFGAAGSCVAAIAFVLVLMTISIGLSMTVFRASTLRTSCGGSAGTFRSFTAVSVMSDSGVVCRISFVGDAGAGEGFGVAVGVTVGSTFSEFSRGSGSGDAEGFGVGSGGGRSGVSGAIETLLLLLARTLFLFGAADFLGGDAGSGATLLSAGLKTSEGSIDSVARVRRVLVAVPGVFGTSVVFLRVCCRLFDFGGAGVNSSSLAAWDCFVLSTSSSEESMTACRRFAARRDGLVGDVADIFTQWALMGYAIEVCHNVQGACC